MTALSGSVRVSVKTQYLPDANPHEPDKYTFAYHISIYNEADEQVQLLNRYWLITDGDGKKTEVKGAGVVGEQPEIAPGGSYQYTSGAMLDTPVGTMEGFYEMIDASGNTFKAPIAVFSLNVPNLVN